MNPTVGVVAQGAMGAGVGRRLVERGVHVVTSLAGGSEASAARAREAGMVAVSDEEVARADFLLSIVPPSDALSFAEKMAALIGPSNRKPIYVDCNAVSPPTKIEIGNVILKAGSPFVDASIIGMPPKNGQQDPAIYASGPDAGRFAPLGEFGLLIRVIDGPVGAAAATKMSYAGITKGLTACARSSSAASLRSCPGSSARSRRCTPRPIVSSARWKRSGTLSARTRRRGRCSRPSPSSTRASPPTTKGRKRKQARCPRS
jgi:putative dehydrogenase